VNCKFEHWNQIYRLFIPLCERNNAGQYTCVVQNEYGDVTYCGGVVVNESIFPPKFFNHTNDLTAQKGQPCQLDAMIKGKPKPLVEWYKDTRALVERDGLRFLQEGNQYSLYIPEVTDNHCGTYKCIAFNNAGESACIIHLKLKAGDNNPPRFWRSLSDMSTVCGKTMKLNVTIHSKTPVEVCWYRNERPVDAREGFTTQQNNDVYSLLKEDITQQDEGSYKCEVMNNAGTTTCQCRVSVHTPVDLPVFTKGLSDIQVVEYERSFILDVEVLQGMSAPPEVLFYKNGAVIESGARRQVYSEGNRHILKLKYVLIDDGGEYVAVASNSNGDMAITKSFVEVLPHNTPPQFLNFTHNLDLDDGENLTLAATIKGHPPPNVTWVKDGTSIQADTNHIIKEEGYNYSLTVPHATSTQTGSWQCLARNNMGQTDVWMRVSVKPSDNERPPKFLQSLHNVEVGVGDTLVLETVVKAEPPPTAVKWFKQDKMLTNNKRTVITSNANNGKNILIINRVDRDDCGDYECVAHITSTLMMVKT
jgi:titin